jgi:hypothetical protein
MSAYPESCSELRERTDCDWATPRSRVSNAREDYIPSAPRTGLHALLKLPVIHNIVMCNRIFRTSGWRGNINAICGYEDAIDIRL